KLFGRVGVEFAIGNLRDINQPRPQERAVRRELKQRARELITRGIDGSVSGDRQVSQIVARRIDRQDRTAAWRKFLDNRSRRAVGGNLVGKRGIGASIDS